MTNLDFHPLGTSSNENGDGDSWPWPTTITCFGFVFKKRGINCVRVNCVHDLFELFNASKYSKNFPQVAHRETELTTFERWNVLGDVVYRMATFSLSLFRINIKLENPIRGELNPKLKLLLFERTLKTTKKVIFQFLNPLLRFWDILVSLICKLQIAIGEWYISLLL